VVSVCSIQARPAGTAVEHGVSYRFDRGFGSTDAAGAEPSEAKEVTADWLTLRGLRCRLSHSPPMTVRGRGLSGYSLLLLLLLLLLVVADRSHTANACGLSTAETHRDSALNRTALMSNSGPEPSTSMRMASR
jgi:hypothetical protein